MAISEDILVGLTDGAQLREQPTPTVHAQSAWIVPEETRREKKPAVRICFSDLLDGLLDPSEGSLAAPPRKKLHVANVFGAKPIGGFVWDVEE